MSGAPPDDRALWDIWLSAFRLPAVAIADELGVFEALAIGPSLPAQVAAQRGLEPRATAILLDMLGALGLAERDGDTWHLTGNARTFLLPGSPFYWGPLLKTLGVVPHHRASLLRALRPAEAAPREGGRPADAWQSGAMSPEQAERVTGVMHAHSSASALAAAASGVFSGVERLLDVGGGSGVFAIAIARALPATRCTVMELPAVAAVAQRYIAEAGLSDRVDVTSVDMFRERWPEGYDAIFFSNVFHDWDEATNTKLARAAAEALPSGGRIFLHEMLATDTGETPLTTAGFSLLMTTSTNGGKQYTLAELSAILAAAGFGPATAHATHAYYSVVTATKS